MADFRMKLFTLAGMATVFAGMAFGQAVCASATANAVFVRAESNDDQVADTTVVCTVPAANAAVTAGQTMSMTVYLSPSVNITSANIGTSSTPKSEAIAGVNATPTTYQPVAGAVTAPTVFGSVSGNSVTFSSITLPAIAVGATQNITITNIKIAASTVATGSGVPTGISETIFVSGTGVTPNAITTGSAVAYVTNGLGGIKSSGTTSNALCNATNTFSSAGVANAANYVVTFAEAFPNSFKIQGTLAANATLGSWYANHSETGYAVTATNSNLATSGTRVKLIFNNVPANVTVYVPISFGGAGAAPNTASAATNGAVLTLTASETGAFSAVAASTANGAPGSVASNAGPVAGNPTSAALTVTSGSATAIYEVTTVSTAPGTFAIPVFLQASAGAVPAPTTAITTTVSFAPIGASSNVPNFVNGSSTATVNGSTYAACSTTLLFPYVTNQAGFESGLAISNTGADLLSTKNGAPISSVTGQSGTCLLTFFGNATASSNPTAFTTASAVSPGTTWTGTLTSVVGGTPGNFGGYMIANCNFLYAHGFTYITYNIGQSSGMAMGYVASPLNLPRATIGGGDGFLAVTSQTPESLGN